MLNCIVRTPKWNTLNDIFVFDFFLVASKWLFLFLQRCSGLERLLQIHGSFLLPGRWHGIPDHQCQSSDHPVTVSSLVGMHVFVKYWIRFEWNKRRCTYVHWRIYSSRDLDTLLHKVEVISIEGILVFIQSHQRMRNVRIALRSQLTSED